MQSIEFLIKVQNSRTENKEQRTKNSAFSISQQSQFAVSSHFEGAQATEKSHLIGALHKL